MQPIDSVVVTLVHGTFAPNAAWTHPGSVLRETLLKTFSGFYLHFENFIWSGDNTHDERVVAAKALDAVIDRITRDYPSHMHVIVGHSHGGNVILRSLVRRRPHTVIAVVLFNTPFIQSEHDPKPAGLFTRLMWLAHDSEENLRREEGDRFAMSADNRVELLVVRPIFDEALWFLRAADTFSVHTRRALVLLGDVLGGLSALAFYCAIPIGFIWKSENLLMGLLGAGLIGVFLSLLIRVTGNASSALTFPFRQLAYGESLWTSLAMTVTTSHLPPKGWRFTERVIRVPSGRPMTLRHSVLYDDPPTALIVSHWIREKFDAVRTRMRRLPA